MEGRSGEPWPPPLCGVACARPPRTRGAEFSGCRTCFSLTRVRDQLPFERGIRRRGAPLRILARGAEECPGGGGDSPRVGSSGNCLPVTPAPTSRPPSGSPALEDVARNRTTLAGGGRRAAFPRVGHRRARAGGSPPCTHGRSALPDALPFASRSGPSSGQVYRPRQSLVSSPRSPPRPLGLRLRV